MAMKDQKRQIIKLSIMIGLTFIFFLCELVVGHITNSLALIGDSYHMISDVLALVIGLACLAISTRSSKQNTFGWARAEILGALVNSVFLAALCFTIFIEAIQRLITPNNLENPKLLLIVGSVGLLINLLGLAIFYNETHGHSHGGNARQERPIKEKENFLQMETCPSTSGNVTENVRENGKIESFNVSTAENRSGNASSKASQMNIKGVFLHILGDALGSLVVITSALVVIFCEGGWVAYVDPVLSIFIVVIILSTTYSLLKQSALILIQHVPDHIRIAELSQKLCSEIDGILGIHELHIWQLVGNRIIASVHVKCRNAEEYKSLSVKIKDFFHDEGIHSTTIQPEFVEVCNQFSTIFIRLTIKT
ncbi:hypothetical protein HELRODRAFT_155708 [Helobdella robusta]|uniref:Zinc transporter 1 n=1 Tax=Helobdella robusta TaxID=6412 RepID=T1ELL2_HELRO|nr:hypothetical protein HELRODRAFT_155708 [Helobdella robusta]ESO06461.1 hypothetical protein HELRODRAFT_155708 [Helobdella robusta]